MSVWKILETLLREDRKFRGESGWTLKQLNSLLIGKPELDKPGLTGEPAKREGDAMDCDYRFDPGIWTGFHPGLEPALVKAATGGEQHAGRPQGDMMFKTTWGQKVVAAPGKARTDFERLPSAMDTYDVVMAAEIAPDRKGRPVGMLKRFVYSPAIGSTDERRARLQAMMAGQGAPALRRRPQPERPEPPPGSWDKNPAPRPVPRVGQNVRGGGKPED